MTAVCCRSAANVGRRPQGRRTLVDVVEMRRLPGLVPYDDALVLQRELHAARVANEIPDTVLLLEHEPVYTAGKRTEAWERPAGGVPVVDVDRGGRITWHGPGQLTGYPIVRLTDPVDVVAYVRRLEQMLIDLCTALGVGTERVAGRSGVWIPADDRRPDRKVAAIGVRVARGVTMHGFALNCDCALDAFDAIVPCGIRDAGVTSLTVEAGSQVTVADVVPHVDEALTEALALAPAPAHQTASLA